MEQDKIREAFERVKNDINELKGQLEKLVDRVNDLAIDVKKKKK